ncbi:hypothetical protein [Burkholderia multivorans]|uniref:hypothetical protein n=1 Tax=Burkholderia multivorans TaxID=87883 RepID=UPI0021BFDA7C|nr:hypothetical protein [Burkholderia multivorans]
MIDVKKMRKNEVDSMIDQDKMRALAKCLRADADFAGERESGSFDLRYEAADAIDLLLAEVEASAEDKRDAERYRWMAEHFLGADFEWGRSEDGYGGIPALVIEIPETAKVWGCLDLTIDDQLSRTPASEGEQK